VGRFACHASRPPSPGPHRWGELPAAHIRDWIAKQKATGLSPSTIAGNKTILSAIFTTALADQVVFLHPCAGVKTPTVARKPRVIVTPEQYDAIHHALPGDAARLLVETAIESGLRWGELTELRPSDLELNSQMLTVSRAVTETTAPADGTRFAVKAYPEDKEYRRLKLNATVCTAVHEHHKLAGPL
jgi:integrase